MEMCELKTASSSKGLSLIFISKNKICIFNELEKLFCVELADVDCRQINGKYFLVIKSELGSSHNAVPRGKDEEASRVDDFSRLKLIEIVKHMRVLVFSCSSNVTAKCSFSLMHNNSAFCSLKTFCNRPTAFHSLLNLKIVLLSPFL